MLLDTNPRNRVESNPELKPFFHRWNPPIAMQVLEQFESWLLLSLDLRREAEDLVELRERCDEMSRVRIPEIHLGHSGERFLTVSDLGGSPVAERGSVTGCADSPAGADGNGGAALARRVCRAWLRLVFSAAMVPTDPRGGNVLVLEDGSIAFCGGPFERLSGHARDHLRSYLAASAIEDHGPLADALLKLVEPRSREVERRLRHELRHTIPFRDGGWDRDSDSLSRTLLAHWHQATALGLRPRRDLSAFLRGLTVLTREVHLLAPAENPFREAFQELRLYELFAESVSLPTGAEVAPLADLPRKLDRGLTLASGYGSRSGHEQTKDGPAGSWSVVLALVMALAAAVLLVHHVGTSAAAPGWIEEVGALVVAILGGSLLRLASD
jgi:hypothetical protein